MATLQVGTGLCVEDLMRIVEMLRPPRERHPRDYLLDEARSRFRELLDREPGAPRLERMWWRTRLETDEIEFEAILERRPSWHWLVRAAPYGVRTLFTCLQEMGEPPFRSVFARASAEHVGRARIFGTDPAALGDDRTAIYGGGRQGTTFVREMTATEVLETLQRVINERFQIPVGHFRLDEGHRRAFLEGNFLDAAWPVNPDAVNRGEKLLREWLSPAQRQQYERDGAFVVRGSHSGDAYRITKRRSYNVDILDLRGQPEWRLCFLPQGNLVQGDIMLAQKIALETNERAALKVANRARVDPPGFATGYVDYNLSREAQREFLQGDWVVRPREPARAEPVAVDSRAWTGLP